MQEEKKQEKEPKQQFFMESYSFPVSQGLAHDKSQDIQRLCPALFWLMLAEKPLFFPFSLWAQCWKNMALEFLAKFPLWGIAYEYETHTKEGKKKLEAEFERFLCCADFLISPSWHETTSFLRLVLQFCGPSCIFPIKQPFWIKVGWIGYQLHAILRQQTNHSLNFITH